MAEAGAFESSQDRALFWDGIDQVIAAHPQVMKEFTQSLEGEMACDGTLFDPESPVAVSASVMILSIRNLDGWETVVVLDPEHQSAYMTHGVVSAACKIT